MWMPASVTGACTVSDFISHDFVLHLSKLADELQASKGAIRNAESNLKNLGDKIFEIEQKEQADAERKRKATVLLNCAEVFARGGLPKRFINYRFTQLVELMSQFLEILGADFSVRVSSQETVSFEFTRTTGAEEYWMPQKKMSGGQRVRTTVSALLALHMLVLPELGLLILDEPSLHLSAEAVEGLRDLLRDVGHKLRQNEAQILFSDHNPILYAACDDMVKLEVKEQG